MTGENFQIYGVKITKNRFACQKFKSAYFNLCLQAKLSSRFLLSSPSQKEITHLSQASILASKKRER